MTNHAIEKVILKNRTVNIRVITILISSAKFQNDNDDVRNKTKISINYIRTSVIVFKV